MSSIARAPGQSIALQAEETAPVKIPLTRGNTPARVGPNGELSLPAGTVVPAMVPLDRGPP